MHTRLQLKIKKIIRHWLAVECDNQYTNNPIRNDIALIQLEESLNSTYMPACLAPKKKDYTGKLASFYGWGRTIDNPCFTFDSNSPVLRTTNATIISNEKCEKGNGTYLVCDTNAKSVKPDNISYKGQVFEDMICIESLGRGICKGDSGGPMTIEEDGKHILVGVTSWSYGCAKVSIY